ncbi:hypothetical protein N5T96_00250 [Aliarcobacter butzleri]|uniref:hypothetical protein n=1 Tax=Aliarcobacter butzleri TaxID=28197 RepID=UPI000DB14AB1|nr:hypothetical protein [Aliarcobacter butzleri]MCG3702832.1 hypothetical protein [Aliarcobacter butzleri]MCT7564763.1 hypothetical protein [Aliarcobacter butzleri]MCT7580784.1 hypothetical protein [Aliarcobacter butzleri]MDN5060411.1 hypothetical protein [Aliarcobacter butzleri]MDS1369669.1 hypothetical protein [Aliarcobacter butzleri]
MKEKRRILWPKSKCCLKKFLDLEFLAKYGSIAIIIGSIAVQSLNIVENKNFELSFFSIIINLFFLVVVLTKLEIIKIDSLEKYLDNLLKIMIFIFLLNFVAYLFANDLIQNYVYAPLSFLGAYFFFLLLYKKSI